MLYESVDSDKNYQHFCRLSNCRWDKIKQTWSCYSYRLKENKNVT